MALGIVLLTLSLIVNLAVSSLQADRLNKTSDPAWNFARCQCHAGCAGHCDFGRQWRWQITTAPQYRPN